MRQLMKTLISDFLIHLIYVGVDINSFPHLITLGLSITVDRRAASGPCEDQNESSEKCAAPTEAEARSYMRREVKWREDALFYPP